MRAPNISGANLSILDQRQWMCLLEILVEQDADADTDEIDGDDSS